MSSGLSLFMDEGKIHPDYERFLYGLWHTARVMHPGKDNKSIRERKMVTINWFMKDYPNFDKDTLELWVDDNLFATGAEAMRMDEIKNEKQLETLKRFQSNINALNSLKR